MQEQHISSLDSYACEPEEEGNITGPPYITQPSAPHQQQPRPYVQHQRKPENMSNPKSGFTRL